MNFIEKSTYAYNDAEVEYHYSATATIMEQVSFVKNVGDKVASSVGYFSLFKDIIFRYYLVQCFTDIGTSMFMDEDGNLDYDIFEKFDNETNISMMLQGNIDAVILTNLIESVDDYIAYKTGIHKDSISTAVTDFIKTLTAKAKNLNTNMDIEKLNGFINKFSESDITSENLVNAYLDSEAFKDNVASVVDAKNDKIRELQDEVNKMTARNVVADKGNTESVVKEVK